MTPEILEYLLRLTVIWAVLIAYYFFALRRAGFAVQRFYLLGSLAFGVAVPLLPALGGGLPMVNLPSVTYVAEPYFYTRNGAAEVAVSSWSWSAVLPWLYLAGVAFFAARTLVQWRGLWSWASSGKTDRYDGYRVIRHRGITGPFVAFGCIFLPAEMSDADLEYTALIHEAAHLRARHHYDTLLLTIGSLLLWFHPLFWMLRRLLATVHEYEADAAVIQRVPVRTYGLQLLQATLMASSTHAPDLQLDSLHGGFVSKILIWLRPNSGFAASPPQQTTGVEGQVDESISPSGPAGYPGLFSSPITKRITMITSKNRARKLRILPLFSLCLLLAGLVVACSDVGEDVAIPLNNDNPFSTMEVDPFEYMEEPEASYNLPYYGKLADPKEARKALLTAVYSTVTYPSKARLTNTTGMFQVLLYLTVDGGVDKITVTETDREAFGETIVVIGYGGQESGGSPVPEVLKAEIERTLSELDEFTPATKNGKAEPSVIPLTFKFILEE